MHEMGKTQSFGSLPERCLFRWVGGKSLFKKIASGTAQVVNRPSEVCHPGEWERTVLVMESDPPVEDFIDTHFIVCKVSR